MAWSFVIILPAIVLVASLVLLFVARRGRRVDDHPICRKCGFDLFGKPSDSTRCSECGAELGRRRAVRIGNRTPYRRLAINSFLLGLICVSCLGVAGYGRKKNVDWNRHAPFWWLARQLDHGDNGSRNVALGELLRRLQDGQLSDAQLAEMVRRALAYQADTSRPWIDAWGQIIVQARSVKKVSSSQWSLYLKQSFPIDITPTRRIRKGDSMVLNSPLRGVQDDRVVAEFRRPGGAYLLPIGTRRMKKSGATGFLGSFVPQTPDIAPGAAPVHYTVHLPVRLKVHELDTEVDPFVSDASELGPGTVPVDEWIESVATIDLLPQDWDPRVNDPSLRAAVEGSLHPQLAWDRNSVRLNLAIDRPPIGLSYDVFVRSEAGEWLMGQIACPKGGAAKAVFYGDVRGVFREQVDVILRPDSLPAIPDPLIDSYFGGTVELKGVPVQSK